MVVAGCVVVFTYFTVGGFRWVCCYVFVWLFGCFTVCYVVTWVVAGLV